MRWDQFSEGGISCPHWGVYRVMRNHLVLAKSFCVRLGGELQLPL